MLVFAERNPGLCRVLTGEALSGENEALRKRASQFFERLETQVRQILKEGDIRQGIRPQPSATRAADWVMTFVEGRIQRYIRSGFDRTPSAEFEQQAAQLFQVVWRE